MSPERLAAAKIQMRAARVKRLQTSEDTAASLAEDFINTGNPHFSDRYVEKVAEVGNDHIKVIAKKFFDRNKLLTSALLPTEFVGAAGLPKAEDLLRHAGPATQAVAEKAAPVATVKKTVLDDGTVLLVKRISTSPLVSMQMYALGGLTKEDAKTNGVGNLTMQMPSARDQDALGPADRRVFRLHRRRARHRLRQQLLVMDRNLPERRFRQGVRSLRGCDQQPQLPRCRASDDEAAG